MIASLSKYECIWQQEMVRKPGIVITIFKSKKKFYFHLENLSNSNSFVFKRTTSQIQENIPHIKHLLKVDPFNIGLRLLLTYKNQLIVHAFSNLSESNINK